MQLTKGSGAGVSARIQLAEFALAFYQQLHKLSLMLTIKFIMRNNVGSSQS
jgi:hypothetical protein